MKIVDKPLKEEYLPVRIFLDDLEAMEELLSKKNSGYRINVEKFEFSNVKEMLKKYANKTVPNLKISLTNPYVTIEFNKMWTRLYVGSDNNFEAGLFYKLNRIISNTVRRPYFLHSYYFLIPCYIIFEIIILLSQGIVYEVVYFSGYVFLVWNLWVVYVRLFKYSEIVLSKRRDKQSFFARKMDEVMVGIITAILGVLATIIAYKLGWLR